MKLNLSTVKHIIRIYKNCGRIEKLSVGGNRKKKLDISNIEYIKSLIDEDCSITLRNIQSKLHHEKNIHVSLSTINRSILGFYYSVKRTSLIPELRNDIETIRMRKEYSISYFNLMESYRESCFFFVDEFGASFSMRTERGRSLRGKKAIHSVRAIKRK